MTKIGKLNTKAFYLIRIGILMVTFIFIGTSLSAQQVRKIKELRKGWLFINKDVPGAANADLDESSWQKVTVPHDWAISGPFNKENDKQEVKVIEDGDTVSAVRTGRTGALPFIGVGWYRKYLTIPAEDRGKRVFIEFDGAMSNAKIYLNGQYIGEWPYGYSSFNFELTKYINWGKENLLAVRLENFPESARWYPGAGIYRHVRLVTTHAIRMAHWGTFITTPEINAASALIKIQIQLDNRSGRQEKLEVQTMIFDNRGEKVGEKRSTLVVKDNTGLIQEIRISKPQLWSAEHPMMYKAVTAIRQNKVITDTYTTRFGIRSIKFTPDSGMLVNGIQTKLKGVCLHHDLGPLGAAFNQSALRHHLQLLKDMGCNAIRGTHNPHAPGMLELCDEMGFYFIDEAFDEWKIPKTANGYNRLFNDWAKKDLEAMIRRDRNHPALIMYSIGNEVREQGDKNGAETARYLTAICHAADSTRPVTVGFNNLESAIKNGLAAVVDVPGWNYKPKLYQEVHQKHPDWPIYGSETASTVSSRGAYMLPAQKASMKVWGNNQSSSYDLEHCSWSQLPDEEWQNLDKNDFVAGEFVWTGVDYLGEPTPYNTNWPSRSSYFGIIDLSGIPKDRYYLYQSRWSTRKVLHLLPHWNWEGKEGTVVPVYVYTNYPAAEVFINGKSYGKKTFNPNSLLDTYRLRWESTVYEAGELKVIAYTEQGEIAETKIIKTAGPPTRIVLQADRNNLANDEEDLAYITVSVTDQEGNPCPLAENMIHFEVQGSGFLRAVGNGNPASLESFEADYRKLFYGKCMAIVQNNGKPGKITIKATGKNLEGANLILNVN